MRILIAALLCTSFAAEEPRQYFKGYVPVQRNDVVAVAEITDEMRSNAPDALDWSTQGATTAVKDQGRCGSCWAYSATEGVESALFMATGQIVELAEQQVISCDKTDGGCNGGDLSTAWDYVKEAGGLDTEADYPDSSSRFGQTGTCQEFSPRVQVTGYKYAVAPCKWGSCEGQAETDLMAALHNFGPLSVCVNAETWNTYTGGIFTDECSGRARKLDHCVQLVGYDATEGWWKVRNSWAADWGEGGFIRLPMGNNACGIADEAMFVTVETVEEEISV